MANSKNQYNPDYVSPPGETLLDILDERGMTQKELAERMDRPEKTINEIIRGKSAITADTAIQLERVVGVPSSFWIQREAYYQEYLAKQRDQEHLEESIDWLNTLPLAQMIKYKWIDRYKNKTEQLKEVLNYFGVASIDSWKTIWLNYEPTTSFRISLFFTNEKGSIASWLRHGEYKTVNLELPEYDEKKFKENLYLIRNLTTRPPDIFKDELKKLCIEAGVALVFTPMISKATISGAVRWFRNRPLIQLSVRGKYNDIFWFTFLHESAHILLHGKKDFFLEGIEKNIANKEKEKEADEFASNFLIPNEEFKEFVLKEDFSPNSIIRFAKRIGIHSGIVVGQLQKLRHIPYSYLSEMKKRLDFEMD